MSKEKGEIRAKFSSKQFAAASGASLVVIEHCRPAKKLSPSSRQQKNLLLTTVPNSDHRGSGNSNGTISNYEHQVTCDPTTKDEISTTNE